MYIIYIYIDFIWIYMDLLTITPFQDVQLVFFKPQISSLFGRVAPTINDSHTGGSSRHFTSIFTQFPTQT